MKGLWMLLPVLAIGVGFAEEDKDAKAEWIQITIREIRFEGEPALDLPTAEFPEESDASETHTLTKGITISKFRTFTHSIEKLGKYQLSECASWISKPGELEFNPGDQRKQWGAKVHPLEKNGMISVDLYFPEINEEKSAGAKPRIPSLSVFLKDGSLITCLEKESEKSTRLIFVRAMRVNSEGIPVDPSNRYSVPFRSTGQTMYTFRTSPLYFAAAEQALAGSSDMANGNYQASKAKYELSLWILPFQKQYEARRKAYQKQLNRAIELEN